MRLLDIINAPWAIQPAMLNQIIDIYRAHVLGPKIDIKAIEARMGEPLNNQTESVEIIGSTAIVSMHGVMGKRMNMFSRISGGVSTQIVGQDLLMAARDHRVERIILDIDSGGGSVDGTEELGNIVREVGMSKEVIAVADGLMASAAYWVGSAASNIYITSTTTQIGSIGVVATHVDYSKQDAQNGINITEITAGKYKRIASENEPLSEEGHATIQAEVDYLYSIFVETVARNRGTTVNDVLENMADARIFTGQQAVDAGLVDGVSTVDQLLVDIAGGANMGALAAHAAGAAVSTEHMARLANHIANDDKNEDKTMAENNDKAPVITLGYLQQNCAELLNTIQADAKAEGITEGKQAGANDECTRIQGVQDQSMVGHDDLIQALMFDGSTTGPEAAVKVLAAEKAKMANVSTGLANDAPAAIPASIDNSAYTDADSGGNGDSADNGGDLDADDVDGINTHCKAEWDKDKALRAEFGGSFESFVSYTTAEIGGRIKILSK